jgi:hypothetical protein
MKKALVVLLILAVAGGAFAQGLTFTGELKSGLGIVYDSVGETAYLEAFTKDGEQPFQFRLHAAYANAEDTAGLKVRLQQRTGTPTIDYAFGYLKAFSNILTVQGGKVDDGTFNSGGGILDADSGEGVGANLLINPIDNLVIGLGAYAADNLTNFSFLSSSTTTSLTPVVLEDPAGNPILDANGDEQYGVVSSTTTTAAAGYPKTGKGKYTFGLSYTVPEIVKVVGTFRTKNTLTTNENSHNQLIAGVNVLALNSMGLKLVAEGRFTDIGEEKAVDLMDLDAFVTVGYTWNALNVGLNFAFYKAGLNSDISIDPVLAFWLYGSYAVTEKIVPRLDALIMLNSYNDNYGLNGSQTQWHNKNFTRIAGVAGNTNQKLFAFRPSVALKIDANNSFEIGDYIGIHVNSNPVFNGKESLFSNVFYVDYVLKF